MARRIELAEARQRAGRFCAFKERSPKEVLNKLSSWGLEKEQADEVLEGLKRESFVDAQRFANAFCNDKFEFNSWGKLKIKASIYPHDLPASVVEAALDRIDEKKYLERLWSLAARKWSGLQGEDLAKRKRKTLAYLVNKGFESDLIWNAIHSLYEDEKSK